MMTKNLLALLCALREVTLDPDTQRNLLQLGSKLEGFLTKRPNETDWQNVQVKIEAILGQHPTLAQRYQQLQSQLQAWTEEELQKWLSSLELRRPSPSEEVPTLGVLPSPLRPERSQELENIVVEVATIILKSNKVAETAKVVLPDTNKLTKPSSQ